MLILITIYDNKFNLNEWFVLFLLSSGLVLVWRLKKRFSTKEAIIYFLYSFFTAMVFDHTISVAPIDYYDVNDNSRYAFMDFLTYLMYCPFGYLFIYFFDRLKVKFSYAPAYVLLWALISVAMEFIAHSLGVYHYKNGYQIYYSFPIYLLTFSLSISLYRYLKSNKA